MSVGKELAGLTSRTLEVESQVGFNLYIDGKKINMALETAHYLNALRELSKNLNYTIQPDL